MPEPRRRGEGPAQPAAPGQPGQPGPPARPAELKRPRGLRGARATRVRRPQRGLVPLPAIVLLAAATAMLAVFAADPIYQTPQLWLVAGAGAIAACVIVWVGSRRTWGALTLVALIAAFAVLVVPVAVPHALGVGPAGFVRGLGDGLAAVALGWKQLLTLTLPVGTYQTVLVPFFVTVMAAVAAATALALRGRPLATAAALPLLAPVLFGAFFGASSLSAPQQLGPFSITAPRELGLWLAAFGMVAVWVAWAAGLERRAALRRGRVAAAEHSLAPSDQADAARGVRAVRRNAVVRGCIATLTVAVALGAATFAAPAVTAEQRVVPRDRIDPEIVVREQVSPLAAYRSWKRDEAFTTALFTVAGEDPLPARLRLAVLDHYDGVDFFVGAGGDSGRFTRFPSGERLSEPSRVEITIEAGYSEIWVPIASPLAGPPSFGGPRAGSLADSFYLNRQAGSAVAVPTARGLVEGDRYTATMSAAPDASLGGGVVSAQPLIDLDLMPQLHRWLKTQNLPVTTEGVTTVIERLRDRGYLSHSLTDGTGENVWLAALSEQHAMRFVSSPGGHSVTRIEQLFAQLNEQESAAGSDAEPQMLVAGIGDDEQFATAAALVARAMGFDSRVVVGVRLGGDDAGVPGVPACTAECRGEHVTAWVEVRGSDGVWAPFDTTPQVDSAPTMLEKGEQLPEFPTEPEERVANESDPPVGSTEQNSGQEDPQEEGSLSALWPVLRMIGLSMLALLLVLVPLLFLPVAKRVRDRRRRTDPRPEMRVLGAWDRLIDDATDSGAVLPNSSRRDIAEDIGVPGAEWVAWAVDRAVYSREGLSEAETEQLTQVVDGALAERRAQRSTWQRLRVAYSLRSLGLQRTRPKRMGLQRRQEDRT